MRYLITGGTGFIGKHLTNTALKMGCEKIDIISKSHKLYSKRDPINFIKKNFLKLKMNLVKKMSTNLKNKFEQRLLNYTRLDLDPGDIVVFPRGTSDWEGHVGFYVGTEIKNNKEYYRILGGNQNNAVSIDLYPAKKALGIRRANKY